MIQSASNSVNKLGNKSRIPPPKSLTPYFSHYIRQSQSVKTAVFWAVPLGRFCHHHQGSIEAAITSETSADFHQTTRRCNPEDSRLHNRRRENLKSHIAVNQPTQPISQQTRVYQ
jgi:hypothetical protein